MRYPPDQKARARRALVHAGARALKTSGFNGIGVDGLAAAAGVTSGAFYSNFPNKEAILEAVIDACVGEPFLSETDSGTLAERRSQLQSFLDDYISTQHSADPADGCVMPALSADVSRADPAVKQAYERKLSTLVDRIAEVLEGDRSDRKRRAWSVVALMVGAIVISRGMPEDSESITASVKSARSTASALVETATSD